MATTGAGADRNEEELRFSTSRDEAVVDLERVQSTASYQRWQDSSSTNEEFTERVNSG